MGKLQSEERKAGGEEGVRELVGLPMEGLGGLYKVGVSYEIGELYEAVGL